MSFCFRSLCDRQLKLTAGMQHITNTRFFTRSASYSLSAPVLWVSGVAHTDIKRQALRPLLQFLQRTVGSRSSVCFEEIETHKLPNLPVKPGLVLKHALKAIFIRSDSHVLPFSSLASGLLHRVF